MATTTLSQKFIREFLTYNHLFSSQNGLGHPVVWYYFYKHDRTGAIWFFFCIVVNVLLEMILILSTALGRRKILQKEIMKSQH